MPVTNRRKIELLGETVPDGVSEEILNQILISGNLKNIEDLTNNPPDGTLM